MREALHILLLDDNSDDRAVVVRELGRELGRDLVQPQITPVADRAGFEWALAAGGFDLVITEAALGWADGLAVLREVKARYPDVPIVMYTGCGTPELAVAAMKAGLDDYVVKSPQSTGHLGEAVHEALARAEARQRRATLRGRTREALEALIAMAQILVTPSSERDIPGEHAAETVEAEREATRTTARRLAELTLRVVGCRRVGIHTVDPEAGLVQALTVVGFTPDQEAHWFERYRTPIRLVDQLGPQFTERLTAGEVVILDYANPPLSTLTNAYAASVLLIAPMAVAGRLIGTLTLDYAGEAHTFLPDEISLAAAVAQLTALVIQRERLLRERAEARARALALDASNRRMDEFLGIASHELRTPLTSIKANIQMLGRRAGQAFRTEDATTLSFEQRLNLLRELPDLLDRTQRSVARLERLVADLLDVSRISAGRLPLHLEPADLRTIVGEAVREQREGHPEREIRVTFSDQSVPLMADPAMLIQAVGNYIGNALKYSRMDLPIEVLVRVEPGEGAEPPQVRAGWVGVRDQGAGLDAKHQSAIWERFYRADVAHESGSGVGLGLGLFITREIVERHGGSVGVESTPGAGSTFWFTVPLAGGAAS